MQVKIDEIIRSRRKTISLEVTLDGRLVVRAPEKTPKAAIEKAVESKSACILSKISAARARNGRHRPKSCADGEVFEYLGKNYILSLEDGARGVYLRGERLVVPSGGKKNAEKRIVAWYKEQAKKVISQRAAIYAGKTGICFKSIRITSALTRWGSCSGKGGICFSWRLVMAPVEMIDYVVVHELAHIEHHDHSAAFWRSVGEIMPDYPARRDWFKENAALLRRDFFID